jgi:hypothetical protein
MGFLFLYSSTSQTLAVDIVTSLPLAISRKREPKRVISTKAIPQASEDPQRVISTRAISRKRDRRRGEVCCSPVSPQKPGNQLPEEI